jgi:hypothetical protein
VTQLDPVAEFFAFRRNTRLYAEFWLRTGARHPDEHFRISKRLDPWVGRVEGAGPEVRAKLLAEIPPEGTA